MSRSIFAASLLTLLSCLSLPAQSRFPNRTLLSITGRVIVPVPHFQDQFEVLLVQNLEQIVQATVVDAQGRYRFTGLPRGTYYIVVKLEGFEDARQRVDLWDFGNTSVDVLMEFKEQRIEKPLTDFSGEQSEVVDVAELSRTFPKAVIDRLESAERDFRQGNYEKVLPVLEEIVQDAPDLYDAHRILGIIYQKDARYRDAETEYRTAAELKPMSAAPLINLGSLYVAEAEASRNQGSAVVRRILNQALASLEAALEVKPDASFAHYLLGITYYRASFFEDAEAHLKQALKMTPGLSDARLALANVYVRMQEWPSAIDQLDAYLVENPKSPNRSEVEAMLSRLVQRSEARLH